MVEDERTRFDIWHEIDYEEVWARFDERFRFRADFYETVQPAIRMAPGCLVVDLAPIFEREPQGFSADEDYLDGTAFQAFADLVGEDEIIALDWQHPSYRYSPRAQVESAAYPAVQVFPNGDYFAHMPADLRWGTFGHPWQRTLTLWGDELIMTFGADLLRWLPRHGQSPT